MRLLRAQNRSQSPSTRVAGTPLYPARRSALRVAAMQSVGRYLGGHTRIGYWVTLKMYQYFQCSCDGDHASTSQASRPRLITVTRVACGFNLNMQIDPSAVVPPRLSAMSTVTKDDPQYDEPSSSTICGDSDLHVGDTTQVASEDHAILIDEEDEHYSTGYSEFCDDDTILLADPDTISNDYSSPTGSSPATILGKRKAPEDSGLSNSVYASYKRHTSTGTGSDSAESSIRPYMIVSLDQSSLSVSKSFLFVKIGSQHECATRDG